MHKLAPIDLGSTALKARSSTTFTATWWPTSRPTEKVHPHADHPEWTDWMPDQIWGGSAAAMKEAVSQISDPRSIRAWPSPEWAWTVFPVDEGRGQLALSLHQLALPQTAQPAGGSETSGPDLCDRRKHALAFLHRPPPALDGRTRAGDLKRTAKWLLIEDYVNMMLCGRMATDYTMASCTLHSTRKPQLV